MSSLILRILTVFVAMALLNRPSAQADSTREFLLSCTYGVLAGALMGAASLATEDDPGSKVHRVARGASLGLYSGILLGLYVVYVVPAQIESDEREKLRRYEERVLPDYGQIPPAFVPPKVAVMPVFENQRLTGASLNYNVVNF